MVWPDILAILAIEQLPPVASVLAVRALVAAGAIQSAPPPKPAWHLLSFGLPPLPRRG